MGREGRKVGSLKRRVRSHVARGDMKNWRPLWREECFQVKMYQTHHSRSTLGSSDVEKLHTPLWREADFEVKMYKTHQVRPTFGSSDVEKGRMWKSGTPLWRKARFQLKMLKHEGFGPFFLRTSKKHSRGCGAKHISK